MEFTKDLCEAVSKYLFQQVIYAFFLLYFLTEFKWKKDWKWKVKNGNFNPCAF